MDIKNEMIRKLRQDCKTLMDVKIPKALENISDEKGVNTYRNLTRALADNIKLIEELEKDDYKPMWSIYETGANGENLTPQVAVWMQNGKGDISNHQVFDIDYGIKADTIDGEETECDLRTTLVELIRDTIHECNTDKSCNTVFDKNDKFKDFYEEWERRFLEEHETQGKKTTYPILKNIRNIGKTTFLVKQAVKNKGIYVCSTKEGCLYAKNIDDRVVVVCGKGVFEVFDDSKLFIDEGIELRNIKNLENVKEYFVFKLYN